MSEISKLTELRKLMLEIEQSLGLQDLTPVERDILYAANEIVQADEYECVDTNSLFDHTLLSGVSRPTFFRALKSLVNKGYLFKHREVCRGFYYVETPDA